MLHNIKQTRKEETRAPFKVHELIMSSPGPRPRILCVGLMCLDVINLVDRYPDEDEDIRAKHQIWQSGGNCTNTAKVLALIGRQCEFLGSLGSGIETE